MYVWFWRNLPGPVPVKLALCLLSFTAITIMLFFWIFPEIERALPFTDVTVEQEGG